MGAPDGGGGVPRVEKGFSEVGSAREEGRVLKQNEKGVASLHKSNLGTCVSRALGVHVLVRLNRLLL
jgi:hypothetical protein